MIPKPDVYRSHVLKALSSGAVRDFRSIYSDIKWKLGLSSAALEQLHESGRTEVSVGLSEALQRFIGEGLVSNPTRTHYQITQAGMSVLSSSPDVVA